MKKLGLIVNPMAGVGGGVGLKGSDGAEIQQKALALGAVKKAGARAQAALEVLKPLIKNITVYAAPGEMGADLARALGFATNVVGCAAAVTTAADTRAAARELAELPVDVLLFAGGDGTARDIYAAVPDILPVVGAPAGVKIHSAVYANSPEAAGRAALAVLTSPVNLRPAEVMDIDETAYRDGRLRAALYGYLSVPALRGVMQNAKAAGHHAENDLGGLAREVAGRIAADNSAEICYIFGAGGTVKAIMDYLGYEGTLLGPDVAQNGRLLIRDAAEADLLPIAASHPCRLIITAIGGQGHIFGRGNQQLSPQVIRAIGLDNIWLVAAAAKIYSLPDQSLFVDTGDAALDAELRGYRRVMVGYQDSLVCRVW